MTDVLDEQEIESPDERLASDDELAEQDAAETPEQDEPQQSEPESPEARSDADVEKAIKRLQKEATRHSNAVSTIMGEDAQQLVPCELCAPGIPGFRWPVPVDDETRVAVLAAVGIGGTAELVDDPETRTCPYCEGHGKTTTGSRVQEQLTRPCPKCGAKGWQNADERLAYDSTLQAREEAVRLAPAAPPAPAATHTMPSQDAWGRPLGHELYGKNPAYLTPDERARDVFGNG